MKTSYFILFISLLLSCTPIKYVTTPKVGEIIAVSETKNDLYVKANQWMVRTFTSAKSVIQFQDKEAGKIMGKYLMKSVLGLGKGVPSIDVYTLITISVKDNATRIDIEPQDNWPYKENVYTYSPEMAQLDIKALINDYKKFISLKEDIWQKPEPITPTKVEAPIKVKGKTNKKTKSKNPTF